nr:hypothetical protein [Tanacetum cinerariifolium]
AKNLEAQMQAKLEEEERLARQKEEETNIDVVVEWDNIKAMMGADYELAARFQEEEREELSIEENSRIEAENESAELNRCLEIIPKDDDDVTIEATPLSSKSLTIVDYKIYKEGRKSFFQNHQSR